MELAEDYAIHHDMQHQDADDVIKEFHSELSKMRGLCLDVGCGTGNITKKLLLPTLHHDVQVVGADISQEMVNYARKNNSDDNLSYIILDIEASELPNDKKNRYDHAVSFYCLHWCFDLRHGLKNIYELLQPNGTALLMFIGEHYGFEEYIRLKQHPQYQPYVQDAHRYVPYFQRQNCKDMKSRLQKMLEDIGFKIGHCSQREKKFQYSSQQHLKNQVRAVNPFIMRVPDNMKNEFVDHLTNEILKHNLNSYEDENNQDKTVILSYQVMIVYVEKSPLAA